MKNKKAWIKIVEAFVAILLIMGVLLIIIDKGYIEKKDVSGIYAKELSILKDIELNEKFRTDILNVANTSLPLEWNDFESNGLGDIKNKITREVPDYLDCEAKLCILSDECILNKHLEEEIYVQSVIISANLEVYSPRQLKLFCWEK
jgi:hypothetical protein